MEKQTVTTANGTVHYGETSRFAGMVVTSCNGRTQSGTVGTHSEKGCGRCGVRVPVVKAAEQGEDDGRAAASWIFDGNTSDETYRQILAGIEDGDPEVMDSLPVPDLSGEWADRMTATELLDMVGGTEDEATDVFEAYEVAFSRAVTDEAESAARRAVA